MFTKGDSCKALTIPTKDFKLALQDKVPIPIV